MTDTTPDAALKRLEKSLVYSTEATTQQIHTDIDRLRAFDAEHERLQEKGKLLGICGIPAAVAGTMIAFLGAKSILVLVLGGILGVAGAVLAIVGFSLMATHKRLNLENRRYEVLSGLMRLLAADIAPDGMVVVKVDFGPHNAPKNLARKGKVGYWNVDFYVSRWFEVRGCFMDGTKFSLAMIDKNQQRHRTKRSASGKIKHKQKTKSASEAVLKMRIKRKRYQSLQDAAKDIKNAAKLPQFACVKSIDAKQDALSLTVGIGPSSWDRGVNEKTQVRDRVDLAASMFLSLYRVLNSAKAIDKA